jgi:hypothetical protein
MLTSFLFILSRSTQGFLRKCSPEVRVCVLRIPLNDKVEVSNCLFVHVNHLVGFGPLMNVSYFTGYLVDALSVRKDGLLELL